MSEHGSTPTATGWRSNDESNGEWLCHCGGLYVVGSEGVTVEDVHDLDDFEVIAERRRVMATLAALTDRYRELNQELQRRESLRWMLAR
jgi:hypothetical protein